MVIPDCNKNEYDTAIYGNINNKEANENISNNDTGKVKTKAWLREHVQLKETLCWDILVKLKCPENLKY